jgi:SPASM domain peptide maturase of grasp-with-spasm system
MVDYFNLYPNCIITGGPVNSLIVDYKKETFFKIPAFLHEIIDQLCNSNINDLISTFTREPDVQEKVIELKNWLISNNLGMMCTKSNIFAQLQNNFKFESTSNAIIEIGDLHFAALKRLEGVFNDLHLLQCQAVQLIFRNTHELKLISEFLKIFDKIIFESVEIIIKLDNEPSVEDIELLISQNLFLKKIFIFGCKEQRTIKLTKFDAVAIFSKEMNYSAKSCGSICNEYFSTNIMTYFESKKHNSCLNQKIAIDKDGNIKNCLSLKENFGNIDNSSLPKVISNDNFRKYWNISKDDINVCKNCEFRYVCTDCRAFVEDPENILSKPLKCGYDPNTGHWDLWSENPLKQKVIKYYGL